MQNINRGPGSPSGRRRAFRPTNEALEDRKLLATVDVGTIQSANLGVETVGAAANSTAGYRVTDVGNINGSGFDSFVVSAPGLPATPIGGTSDFTAAQESAAYLVFGSRQVNAANAVDFASLSSGQRAADLARLGSTGVLPATAQVNPTVTQVAGSTTMTGFNFDGITLVTGLNQATGLGRNSALGFSVSPLGDINGDGIDDFTISAPNDTGGGRVFVIFGGTNLTAQNTTNKTLDLEATPGTTNSNFPTKVVSFAITGAGTGTDVGYSVAGIGNYFNTNLGRDLGIGVPGLNGNTGAVFAIPGTFINSLATGTTVNLAGVGTNALNQAGIQYPGFIAGGRVGASLATAGSFDGATTGTNNAPLHDLLIGAPGISTAYLVYSVQSTLANSTLDTIRPLSTLGILPGANPISTPLQGVVFTDPNVGDRFAFSLAPAGDFNSDNVGDFIVGAPGYNGAQGAAMVIQGVLGTATGTPARLNGVFIVTPGAATTQFKSVSFIGQSGGGFAGYSVASTAHIAFATDTGTAPTTDILIGEPGFVGLGSSGDAFLIPGNATLTGAQSLAAASTSPINGTQFIRTPAITNEQYLAVSGFGTSVSARNPVVDINTLGTTVDNDSVPDLFFGAPLSTLNNPTLPTTPRLRINAGAAFVVEGAAIGGTSSGGGGGTGTGGTGSSGNNLAFTVLAIPSPPIFTGENAGLAFPTESSLSHLTSYRPLPVQLAYNQFLAEPGFRARQEVYHHPARGKARQAPYGSNLGVAALGRDGENKYLKVNTYPGHVFRTGKLKHGKEITFTHKVKVIPRSEQTQTFRG